MVGSDYSDLAPGRVPIRIYLGSSGSSGNGSTGEDSDLDSVVVSDAMSYCNMGSSDSSGRDLRWS